MVFADIAPATAALPEIRFLYAVQDCLKTQLGKTTRQDHPNLRVYPNGALSATIGFNPTVGDLAVIPE